MSALDLTQFAPRRILVCQLRQLGDVVLTTPVLEALHTKYPQAELHLVTEQKCVPLLDNNPHVTKVWGLDKKTLRPLTRELAWYWHVARQGYDLVVDLQQLPRCRWLVAFSAAPVRLAFTPPWYTRPLYTHSAPPLPGYACMTKVNLLAPLGITWQGELPRIYLSEAERIEARTLLESLGLRPGQRLVTIDPTHRRETRRWPLESWAAFIRLLAADPGLRFLPLWGPGEEDDIRRLAQLVALPDRLLLPDNMLGLRLMAACIAEAALHCGNCSAPRHIAVAVGTPSCVALGSTSRTWTAPSPKHVALSAGLDCQPCDQDHCHRHCACLHALSPQKMALAAQDLLAQGTA